MPRTSYDLEYEFSDHLNILEKTCLKTEELLAGGKIALDDIEQVYNGIYISLLTAFEKFLEDLFLGLLSGDIVHNSPSVIPIFPRSHGQMARDILLIRNSHSRDYLDWLPYDRTVARAKAFFKKGEPFTLLSEEYKDDLTRYWCIRNAIVHKSQYSQRMFEENAISDSPLRPEERTPVGYLRSVFRTGPTQTQYELVIQKLKLIARTLCRPIAPSDYKPLFDSSGRPIYSRGKGILSFWFKGSVYRVVSWRELLMELCNIAKVEHRSEFDKVLNLRGRKRVYFTRDRQQLHQMKKPKEISDTDFLCIPNSSIFLEMGMPLKQIANLCGKLLDKFGYDKEEIKVKTTTSLPY